MLLRSTMVSSTYWAPDCRQRASHMASPASTVADCTVSKVLEWDVVCGPNRPRTPQFCADAPAPLVKPSHCLGPPHPNSPPAT